MTTIEDNKLIVEFLGQNTIIANFPQFGYMTSSGNWKDEFIPNELKFHKDWNWLMEVIHKIESLGYEVVIGRISCNVNEMLNRENPIVGIVCGDISKKIEIVFDAVIRFVKWYNQQNS